MNLTQILRGQSAVLTLDAQEDGTDTDLGTVTLAITDLADTAVEAPVVTDNADGTYTATAAASDDVALHKATWSVASGPTFTTWIEHVGNFLFTEKRARAFDDTRLTSSTKFTDEVLAAERVRITDWLETETGVSWVPRYRRLTLRGTGSAWINLRHHVKSEGASGGEGSTRDIATIISATVNDVAVDVADIDIDGHNLYRSSGVWSCAQRPNVVIEYEYGRPHPLAGVDRIALLELADRLPASRLSRAAVSSSDDLGAYSWDPQNNGRPSRIPEVNAWLRSEDRRVMLA
jgi:hypothetical protein